MPKEAPPHGAPTRQYLNSKVTGVLLEGVKQLAKEQYVFPDVLIYSKEIVKGEIFYWY